MKVLTTLCSSGSVTGSGHVALTTASTRDAVLGACSSDTARTVDRACGNSRWFRSEIARDTM